MDKYDTSQLTEFPRFESESSQSGVSTFFNKLWKFPIFSPSETSENLENKVLEDSKDYPLQSEKDIKEDIEDIKPETGCYAVELEGRSLPNVLKRISSLVASGSGAGTRYADTELARYWMPDDISRECYECAARFGTLRRRHHCRVCGQIFCSRCCSQRVPGQIFGCAGGLRVCNYCCNIVLSYLRENDSGEISPDLRTLQESLQVKFPDNKSQLQANKSRDNFAFAHEQDDRSEVRTSPKEALHDIFRQLSYSLPTQQHRYRLVRYNGVWRGCDIMQWIMDNTNFKTRIQASQTCQNLLSSGYMECITELLQFADYALYRPIELLPETKHEDEPPEEHNPRIVESGSSYCLDLNLGENSARLIKAPKIETKSSPSSEEENPILEHSDGYTEPKKLCKAIAESGEEHLRWLMRQCLARASLPPAWLEVLLPLCHHAAEITSPDIYSNDIDVRNYVQVKKVPGGHMRDSCVIPGVVMTKNVAHRGMPQQISNPTVLLLDCSIAFHRVEGKLTSLEPVLMQEHEYLSRCAARIGALRPRVVLVRGAAARAVHDALRAAGVALAVAVRRRALQRAARCVRADVVTSIDARIGMPRLGSCKNFYVKNFSGKTLMVLEGCAEPHLGCCVLLRGASLQELIRVKKVVKFMLLACYNWKLEKAFLADIDAILPEAGMSFVDDEDNAKEDSKSVTSIDPSNISNDDSKTNDGNNSKFNNHGESISNALDNDNKDNDFFNIKDTVSNDANNIFTKSNDLYNEDKKSFDSNSCDANKLSKTQEFDDPLQKAKHSDKNLSCGVPIRDFSDPLRATLSVEDEVFLTKEETKLKADETPSDRWSTDDAVLCMSPNMVIPAPYLLTEAGRRCPLRAFYGTPLVRSPPPPGHAPHAPRPHSVTHEPKQLDDYEEESHPFLRQPIAAPADEPALRAALAHFRAVGGLSSSGGGHRVDCPLYDLSVIKKIPKEPETEEKSNDVNEPPDPLAPENHQKLNLLLYSYCSKSPNVPDFCVNPWIVTMEMYGRHDISLGAFLEKYCFNSDYKCPSNNCQVPMNQHVRKFVHGDVCITITCNTVGHSNVDKTKEEHSKQVTFRSRCERCGAGAAGAAGAAEAAGAADARLSRGALALSLAQYVRARAHTPRYARAAACAHALHTHTHVFLRRHTAAYFRYSKITPYDIELPPEVITIKYDTKQMRDNLINQLNELMLKGHEIFSNVTDSDAEKDYHNFKQHTEQIHLALTSANLQEHTSFAAVVRGLWGVSDRIIAGEKMLRDAQDRWSSPPTKSRPQPENNVEEKSDVEESAGETGNSENASTTYVFADTTRDSERDHPSTEDDEEKGDKKTVRQILSQLLSNDKPSNQSGIIISSGVVPVVVMGGEIGSVIAATLASLTYHRTLRELWAHKQSNQSEQEDADNANASSKDKSDAEKSKPAKGNDHIEVLLKEGLVCRVYYAQQFHKLRHLLMAPLSSNPHIVDEYAKTDDSKTDNEGKCCCEDGKDKSDTKSVCDVEESFLRSLAYCVPWAARGGKSGSTFCKTKDDRYVLKEMTKPEWQQFLEFAPHYFNYVTNCHQNKLPSLLARIVGVYSVGGAGNGVLVMENVFYTCAARARRFDLKGASRAADGPPAGAVLLDRDLLHLRWQSPLHVWWHAAGALWAGCERDTRFLAAHAVMDYSLLLAVDGTRLVLGVIDYIRTFTWDKKLEHLVKKNLGSGQPTVVSPEQYKRRFCAACRKYFLQCPTHWDQFHATVKT